MNFEKFTIKNLIAFCKDHNIPGYSKKRKENIINLINEWTVKQQKPAITCEPTQLLIIQPLLTSESSKTTNKAKTKAKTKAETKEQNKAKALLAKDEYTEEMLTDQYSLYTGYIRKRMEFSKKYNVKIRLPALPEDVSENIIKFIIKHFRGISSYWGKNKGSSGDLFSQEELKQECKCFTSNGPMSFTPSSSWDVIYFLDCRSWASDKFILYRVAMTKSDFDSVQINKKQTFQDQCKSGRRPRISWNLLYPQIKEKTKVIFDGAFADIFAHKNI